MNRSTRHQGSTRRPKARPGANGAAELDAQVREDSFHTVRTRDLARMLALLAVATRYTPPDVTEEIRTVLRGGGS